MGKNPIPPDWPTDAQILAWAERRRTRCRYVRLDARYRVIENEPVAYEQCSLTHGHHGAHRFDKPTRAMAEGSGHGR
jgi:hypothetical protein